MDERIFEAAGTGALVLTVNDRLWRHLAQQFDERQRQQGQTVWRRPDLLSLTAWLVRNQLQLADIPAFLNPTQLQHVWESIIEADVERSGQQLLQVPQTARRALKAHQLLIRYGADFSADQAADDHRAFLRWRNEWQERAGQNGWLDPVELPGLLAQDIAGGSFRVPARLVLAGFDEITPDVQRLCDAMAEAGTSVERWQPQPCRNPRRLRVAASDPSDEVRQCARWARAVLAEAPSARIGVIAPQLECYRTLIEELFIAELEPQALVAGEETQRSFNLSLGRALDEEGVIHAALRLLRFGRSLSHVDLSWLLLTPYLGRSVSERADRARLERELRRLQHHASALPRLPGLIKGLCRRHSFTLSGLTGAVETLSADLRRTSRRMPGGWAEHFVNLLHKLGWPGERSLSSREYQAVQQFRQVLVEMAGLDGVSAPMDRARAVTTLARLVAAREFQPEGAGARIQVLGELESAGLTFDHLWVLGLHDTALPRPPSPNPFIPLPIQRRFGMKRADAEREHFFAEQVAARLFSAAPNIVLSWPTQENGAMLRPSPFIGKVGEGLMPEFDSCDPASVLGSGRPVLEQVADFCGPSLASRKPSAGGTGIIKDQALCPFRAFAHHRLKAEQVDTPDIGLDNLSRGALAHTALELFWDSVVDHERLHALDDEAFSRELRIAIDGALERLGRKRRRDLPERQLRIERTRLSHLLRQWLDVERQRDPFRVLAAEKGSQVRVGGLTIMTRIDRIDELQDGSCAVIDYKTGLPDPLQWLDERITEPQLPIYCLGLPRDKVGAVMFAVVRGRRNECGFRGLERAGMDWPGMKSRTLAARLDELGWTSLDQVLSHWQSTLTALGDAFVAGEAKVDPVDPELACKYCDLPVLCRIAELGTSPAETDDV